ncbi:unnamed protein product [Sphagnum balticum]
MSKPSKPPARLKSETQQEAEQPTAGGFTPNAKLHFGILGLTGTQTQTPKVNANPFTNPGEGNREVEQHSRPHVEATEGWSFQGKRRHTPKLASPRQDATQFPFCTSQRDATRGGKKGLMHLENKRHLHWKALEHIPSMNNKVEFVVPAHNVLRKTDVENMTRQAHKNRTASILAFPQAARKKRFTKLDLTLLMTSQKGSIGPIHTDHKAESEDQKPPPSDHIRLLGLINQLAARNRLTYD